MDRTRSNNIVYETLHNQVFNSSIIYNESRNAGENRSGEYIGQK